jgi:hypothetical protein
VFELVPEFIIHVDDFFSTTYAVTPSLTATATGYDVFRMWLV